MARRGLRGRCDRTRRIATVAILVTASLLGPPALARHRTDDHDRPYWRTNLFKRVVTDQKFLVTRWWPLEIKDPAFSGTLAAGLAIAIQSRSGGNEGQDFDWEQGIHENAGGGVRQASAYFTKLGNGAATAALLGITYLSARRAHDDRLAEASSLAAESLLDAGIWIVVLKAASARVRPNNTGEGQFFQYGNSQNGSFPSGHAMAAFSVASVFAETYHDKKWVAWLSYGLATAVGASRVVLGRHFPSDIIVGGVLGASIGRGVVARSAEEPPRRRGEVVPIVGMDGRGAGVGWKYSWK